MEGPTKRPFASPKFDVRAILELSASSRAVSWLNSQHAQLDSSKEVEEPLRLSCVDDVFTYIMILVSLL